VAQSFEWLGDSRYEIQAQVGYGAAAVVYRGYDRVLRRQVALKLFRQLRSQTRRQLLERVRREGRAMAVLAHPNVVTLYDAGEIQGRMFLCMEYIEGCSLDQWLSARRRPWQETRDLFLQVGGALAAAHALGLIHCDFNPTNVLVDKDGRAHLIDFGLVTSTDSLSRETLGSRSDSPAASATQPSDALLEQLIEVGLPVGTPEYMAPEQFLHLPLSHATDQFSFCVALHEALYGVRPHSGDGLWELGLNVIEGRLQPAPELDRPTWLYDAIARGLSPAPRQRHPSMAALLAALSPKPASR
jgi:serine/threonine protein kinase